MRSAGRTGRIYWSSKARIRAAAITSKTSKAPPQVFSAFRLPRVRLLDQEPTADKGGEIVAIPLLLGRRVEGGSLNGALVSVDEIACDPKSDGENVRRGSDSLLAFQANQLNLRHEVEEFIVDSPPERSTITSQ